MSCESLSAETERTCAEDVEYVRQRTDRLVQTLSVIALTLADFRDRLEVLERPSRWDRFRAWWRANVYAGYLVYEDEPYV